jgi:hypothetical protein
MSWAPGISPKEKVMGRLAAAAVAAAPSIVEAALKPAKPRRAL